MFVPSATEDTIKAAHWGAFPQETPLVQRTALATSIYSKSAGTLAEKCIKYYPHTQKATVLVVQNVRESDRGRVSAVIEMQSSYSVGTPDSPPSLSIIHMGV